MGFFNSAKFFIFPKILVIILSSSNRKIAKKIYIFKQSYCDKINQNELNSMYSHVSCLKRNGYFIMLFSTPRFPHLIISPIMTKEKRKGWQRIRATEAFECKNTRSDYCCIIIIKWILLLLRKKKNYVRLTGILGSPKGYSQIRLPLILMVLLMKQ